MSVTRPGVVADGDTVPLACGTAACGLAVTVVATNALAVVERIEARAESLNTFPTRGRIVTELRNHGVLNIHELFEKPWRLIYIIEGQHVRTGNEQVNAARFH